MIYTLLIEIVVLSKGNIINSDFIGILTNLAFLRDSLKEGIIKMM